MGEFTITQKGVPFTVKGVETEEQARLRLEQMLVANPQALEGKRARLSPTERALSLGQAVDPNTLEVRERTSGEEFAIGAGQSVNSTINFISDFFSNPDPDELEQRRREEVLFAQLDDQGIGAEDAGQLAAGVAEAVIPAGGVASGIFKLFKALSPFKLAAAPAKKLVQALVKKGAQPDAVVQAVKAGPGKKAVEVLANTKKPTAKVAQTVSDRLAASSGVVKPAQAGANKAVRAAQLKARRELREPAKPPASGLPGRGEVPRPASGLPGRPSPADTSPAGVQRSLQSLGRRQQAISDKAASKAEFRDLLKNVNTRTPAARAPKPKPTPPRKPARSPKPVSSATQAPPLKKVVQSKPGRPIPARTPQKVTPKPRAQAKTPKLHPTEERLLRAEEAFAKLKVKDRTPGFATFGNASTRSRRLR